MRTDSVCASLPRHEGYRLLANGAITAAELSGHIRQRAEDVEADEGRVSRLLTAAIGTISTAKEPDNEDQMNYCRAVAHNVTGNTDDGPRANQQERSKGAGIRDIRRP